MNKFTFSHGPLDVAASNNPCESQKTVERNIWHMFKKIVRYLVPIPVLLALAACSALNLPGAAAAAPTAQPGGAQFQFDPASQPVESRLALGTLALEGTANAVTAEQAQSLLPLWKAVKSLSAGDNPSQDEIDALYQQIEDTMTPAQLDAIRNAGLSQENLQALMQKYGIQFPQGGFGGPNAQGTPGANPGLSADQIATLRAERAQRAQNGGGDGGGFTLPDGFVPGQGFNGGGGRAQRAQGTPQPGQSEQFNRGFNRGGANTLFVDPLITLLEQRASS